MLGEAVVNTGTTENPEYGVVETNKYYKKPSDSSSIYKEDNIVKVTYDSRLNNLEAELVTCMVKQKSAKTIVDYVKDIIDIKYKIQEINTTNRYNDSLTGSYEYNSGESTITEKKPTDEDYAIGSIGSLAISVTERGIQVVTPYGYTKDLDGNYSDKLLGIELAAKPGDNIKSQWNGIVANIAVDKETGKSTITISHGNGLYTQYSHIEKENNINVGSTVSQGQIIGSAVDTTVTDSSKRNHIYYQVILDDEYINPLTVYGSKGKQIYDLWSTSTPLTNYVEKGEAYYINEEAEDVEKYKQFSTDQEKVIYPDFNRTFSIDDKDTNEDGHDHD